MVPVSTAPEEEGWQRRGGCVRVCVSEGGGGVVARQTELLGDEVWATQQRSTPGYLLTQA